MKKIAFKLLGVATLALSILGGWLGLELYTFNQTPLKVGSQTVVIEVPAGSNFNRVAHELEKRGLIKSALYFKLLSRWRGGAERIHAGEYAISPGMTPMTLRQRMIDGEVIQYSFTVIEGWTFRQMLQALWQHAKIDRELTGLEDGEIMARLGHPGENPEGRFYPDTYRFPAHTSDIDFLKRAYDAMTRVLAREWQQRAEGLPLKTPYEALILASIIEKETAVPSERAEIAGVFIRRLKKGMRLQTDPTVIYGMGKSFDGNIRRRDLRRDTPYNTYTRKGLPPTPIALPSGESIHAALHPKAGTSLYFVAKGDGSHYFSATIEEHNAAVRRYQLNKRAK